MTGKDMIGAMFLLLFSFVLFSGRGVAQIKYVDMRQEIISAIAGAEKRVFLVSDLLTDGEIATSLFMAQYRKLTVGALLGRANAQAYTSRLRYLREQNVPTGLRSNNFLLKDPTVLIVDNRIARIDGNLDAYASYKNFRVQWESNADQADRLASLCQASLTGRLLPRPLPQAGRPGIRRGPGDDAYKPTASDFQRYANSVNTEEPGVHRPSMIRTERPKDVPDKLPKVPLWQRRLRESESDEP